MLSKCVSNLYISASTSTDIICRIPGIYKNYLGISAERGKEQSDEVYDSVIRLSASRRLRCP